LSPGVYKLTFSDFDGLIRQIKINSNKIVVADRVYLADSNLFFDNIEKPSNLYTELLRSGQISFKTWHTPAFQTVSVNDNPFEVNKLVEAKLYTGDYGAYEIVSEKNDVIVEVPGYLAFSKETYFEPFKNRRVPLKSDSSWLLENADYVLTDYLTPKFDNGFVIASTEFSIEDLYLKDRQLSLVFNTPHLNTEEYQNKTISLDWINITVYKSGLLDE